MEFQCIGKSVLRTDAYDKVTGRAQFTADIKLPGMLYARILRGEHGHAKIISIDTSEAEAMPGVRKIVTGQGCTMLFGACIKDQPPLATDKVRHAGEGVAAVIAETEKEAEEAMKKIENLFRLAAEGSDDDIAEVIDEIHPRAVKKVFEFLDLLVQQQAWCGLEFGDRSFRYADYEQLKASSARLRDDNIQEREESYRGEFQGVLPAGRTFEFKLLDQEGLIRGKVDAAIADPDILNREWLHKPVTIKLNVMQVGQGRPRFTLMSLDDLTIDGSVSP